jgi:aspartyl-tRNA(Asn)/glutamyl-tRNA(Gln) amidotransferase subunit A
MCLAAIGSQTGGSITRPAAYCGVAGCKPTYGRVSCHGVLPLAFSMDHPGPIATCVHDLALVLQTIAGPDVRDRTCAPRAVPNYQTLLNAEPGPVCLGRLREHFEDRADPDMRALMDRVCSQLRSAGATVAEVALPAAFREVVARHQQVMAVESASYHGRRLRAHPEDYAPRISELIEEGLASPAPEYARTKEHQRQLKEAMRACFNGVDALIMPATTGAAPDAATTGDPAFNSPWSYTGLPVVSFRAGWNADGLPLAVQLAGPAWSEGELFAAAAWCEAVLKVDERQPPG